MAREQLLLALGGKRADIDQGSHAAGDASTSLKSEKAPLDEPLLDFLPDFDEWMESRETTLEETSFQDPHESPLESPSPFETDFQSTTSDILLAASDRFRHVPRTIALNITIHTSQTKPQPEHVQLYVSKGSTIKEIHEQVWRTHHVDLSTFSICFHHRVMRDESSPLYAIPLLQDFFDDIVSSQSQQTRPSLPKYTLHLDAFPSLNTPYESTSLSSLGRATDDEEEIIEEEEEEEEDELSSSDASCPSIQLSPVFETNPYQSLGLPKRRGSFHLLKERVWSSFRISPDPSLFRSQQQQQHPALQHSSQCQSGHLQVPPTNLANRDPMPGSRLVRSAGIPILPTTPHTPRDR